LKKRSKGHADAYKRFCIDCGIRRPRWQPGQFLKSEGGDIVLCRVCRTLQTTDDAARGRGLCGSCAKISHGQTDSGVAV